MERAFGSEGGDRGWWNMPRMAERLKLSDEQRKAMDAILLEHKEKLIDLRGNLEKAELAMQPLLSADTPNDSATLAQIDKVVAARAELERANARFLLAIRDKLTTEQWKQLQSFRENPGPMPQHNDWRRDGQRPGMPGPGSRPQHQQRGPQTGPQQPGTLQAPPAPQGAPGTGAGTTGPGQGTGDDQ
jgi:Spy/CpxP family protein refolding chaperone